MGSRATVVIADSSPAASQQLAEVFEASGMQVVGTCTDGIGLVTTALEQRPDVVVFDLILPKLTGLQALAAIRRKGLTPTFVVASSVSAQPRVIAAKNAGVASYILKPFSPDKVARVAVRLVDRLAGGAS